LPGCVLPVPDRDPAAGQDRAERVYRIAATSGSGAGHRPDEKVIIVHPGPSGPVDVARHGRARSGSPAIIDEHFPGAKTKTPGDYAVKARTAGEAEFLAIGEGARTWLIKAAAGAGRLNVKWPRP
jgi:hypothetical protein